MGPQPHLTEKRYYFMAILIAGAIASILQFCSAGMPLDGRGAILAIVSVLCFGAALATPFGHPFVGAGAALLLFLPVTPFIAWVLYLHSLRTP